MQYSPYEVRQSDRLESHHDVRKVFVCSDSPKAGHDRTCLPWQYRFAGFTQAGLIIIRPSLTSGNKCEGVLVPQFVERTVSLAQTCEESRVTDVLQPTHR